MSEKDRKTLKQEVRAIIISDLEKHFELLKTIYGSKVDLCEKLTNLVHQVRRR